jgi:hypothetical protein
VVGQTATVSDVWWVADSCDLSVIVSEYSLLIECGQSVNFSFDEWDLQIFMESKVWRHTIVGQDFGLESLN